MHMSRESVVSRVKNNSNILCSYPQLRSRRDWKEMEPCLLACLEEEPSSTARAASLISQRYLAHGPFPCASSVIPYSMFTLPIGHTCRLTARLGLTVVAEFQGWKQGPHNVVTLHTSRFNDHFRSGKSYKINHPTNYA